MALHINKYIKLRDTHVYMFNCCNQVNGELPTSSEINFHLTILFSKFENQTIDVKKFYNYFFYLVPFNFFNGLVLKFLISFYNLIYDGTFTYWYYTVKHYIFHNSLYRDFDIKVSDIAFLNSTNTFLLELEHWHDLKSMPEPCCILNSKSAIVSDKNFCYHYIVRLNTTITKNPTTSGVDVVVIGESENDDDTESNTSTFDVIVLSTDTEEDDQENRETLNSLESDLLNNNEDLELDDENSDF